jgi:hypothetical protein
MILSSRQVAAIEAWRALSSDARVLVTTSAEDHRAVDAAILGDEVLAALGEPSPSPPPEYQPHDPRYGMSVAEARAAGAEPHMARVGRLAASLPVNEQLDDELAALTPRSGPGRPLKRRVHEIATRTVLKECRELVFQKYGDDVPNGGTCQKCGVFGLGVPEPHKPDCEGVRLLADIDAILEGDVR